MTSPASHRASASVTFPTARKVHSMWSFQVGGEAMQKVDSPSPKTE